MTLTHPEQLEPAIFAAAVAFNVPPAEVRRRVLERIDRWSADYRAEKRRERGGE